MVCCFWCVLGESLVCSVFSRAAERASAPAAATPLGNSNRPRLLGCYDPSPAGPLSQRPRPPRTLCGPTATRCSDAEEDNTGLCGGGVVRRDLHKQKSHKTATTNTQQQQNNKPQTHGGADEAVGVHALALVQPQAAPLGRRVDRLGRREQQALVFLFLWWWFWYCFGGDGFGRERGGSAHAACPSSSPLPHPSQTRTQTQTRSTWKTPARWRTVNS